MPEELNVDILITTAREKHSLVLTREQVASIVAQGAPISPDGDFDPLDLAAWLVLAAQGRTP